VGVEDGYRMWSGTFDRVLTDVLAVQDEIARAVVLALEVRLLAGHVPTTREHRTANSAVYTQYLLGRQFYSRFTKDDGRRAVEAFEKSIALDPSYAPPWSALAIELLNMSEHDPDASATMRRALQAAEKAIALAPDLAEGYAARGLLRACLDWDWRGAEGDLHRALALSPGDADTQRRYGVLLGMLGRRDEAIAATRRALDLDPLAAANWGNLAGFHMARGELALARNAVDRALEISPDMSDALQIASFLLLFEGQPERALAATQRGPEPSRLIHTAMAQHTLGHARESQQALDTLIGRYADAIPLAVAAVYVWRGELDQAFAWFERAYARHDNGLAHIHDFDMVSTSLHRDPRFQDLLRRMGLLRSS